MIPILFERDETLFKSNGIGRLTESLSCLVTEERNGIYECELKYPLSGKRYADITEGAIIYATHDETRLPQPFEIYKRSAPMDGVVTFNARHISHRLSNVILQPFSAESCAQAFSLMVTKSVTPNPFTFWTDKAVSGTFTVTAPKSVKDALGGSQGSILDVYGRGDYEWDGWTVKLHLNRGSDNGVTIEYGKNLTDLTQEIDVQSTYNAVVPFWLSDTGVLVTLPEWVYSIAGELHEPVKCVTMDLSDKFEQMPTYAQMRATADRLMRQNASYAPSENIEVNFVALWQTPEYEQFSSLQRVKLCDTVTVKYPALGVNARKSVIRVVYDVLAERYATIELGTPKTNFADTIKAETEANILPQVATQSTIDAAVAAATNLLRGGAGGHVLLATDANGKPTEIYIMDTESVETAEKVLRINMLGIGFSQSGVSGTYKTAWTIDGHFVADFIDTGTLDATLIKAGTLTDTNGLNYWNLETGALHIAAIDAAQTTADNAEAITQKVSAWMEFGENGLRQGKSGSTYSTLIDSVGFHVLQNGEKISSFARRQLAVEEVRIGRVNVTEPRCVMREAGDGGMLITVEGLT